MKACFHKGVCKHLIVLGDEPDGPCAIVEACKFYVGMDSDELKKGKKEKTAKRHYKKRGPKPGKRKYTKRVKEPSEEELHDDGISKKAFDKAKKKIINAKANKGINENQERAFDMTKGLRFTKMNQGQKQQIIDIAKDL